MYRYAHTKNRVHRVIVEGGKAFKVEQCNLDDTAFFHLDDEEPPGIHCAYCWVGWVAPTEKQKAEEAAAAEEEKKAFTKSPETKPVPLVTSTRRMAAAAIMAAALAGGAVGFVASPDPTSASDTGPAIDDLRTRIEALLVEVRVLQVNVDGHAHEAPPPGDPVIIVMPTPVTDVTDVTDDPTEEPSSSPSPSSSPQGAIDGRSGTDGRDGIDGTTQIIVVQPTAAPSTPGPVIDPHVNPTPQPTAQPTAVPTPQPTTQPTPSAKPSLSCVRPGNAYGTGDPCKFPHAP